jgi:soluble lytic murein transglycosylase-like protein
VIAEAILSGLLSMPSCNGISHRILHGIVETESTADPLAIHDDTDGRSYYPREWRDAAATVVALEGARHAFSVGLMQIENVNWKRYHVTGIEMLDPYRNVAVGCSIYRENLPALYAYNTGSPRRSRAGDRYAEAVYGVAADVRDTPATRPRPRITAKPPAPKPKATPFAFGTLAHPVVFVSTEFGTVHRGRQR